MPNKQNEESAKDKSARFECQVRKLIEADESNSIEVDKVLDGGVREARPQA